MSSAKDDPKGDKRGDKRHSLREFAKKFFTATHLREWAVFVVLTLTFLAAYRYAKIAKLQLDESIRYNKKAVEAFRSSGDQTERAIGAFKEQVVLMRTSVALTERSVKNSVTATNLTRSSAERQLKLAGDTLRADQRPWIVCDSVEGALYGDLIIRTTNRGRGPALNVKPKSVLTFNLANPDAVNWLDREWAVPFQSIAVIGGGSSLALPQKVPMLQLGEVRTGLQTNKPLYVFGRIDYSDQFGESHRTIFCAVYQREQNPQVWKFCDKYNEAN